MCVCILDTHIYVYVRERERDKDIYSTYIVLTCINWVSLSFYTKLYIIHTIFIYLRKLNTVAFLPTRKHMYIQYTLLYPSTVASFLMPNHLAGSTGSLYREEFNISSGNRFVSFVRGYEEKRKETGQSTPNHSVSVTITLLSCQIKLSQLMGKNKSTLAH